MSRYLQKNAMVTDARFLKECKTIDRLVMKLFRKSLFRIVSTLIFRSYERGLFNSYEMHEILGCFERMMKGDQ